MFQDASYTKRWRRQTSATTNASLRSAPQNYHHQTKKKKNHQEAKGYWLTDVSFTNGLEVAAEDLKGSPP
ncbi:hypothetical protein AKJ61_01250 [candidate division MSBL1 archaeon SCGC-AAA259B11]|uniref:Uncharacterized protein n=1 Tax=candidate division MSBL1 archaeon SCGC-AAA259B11 TaxID=1698260 RepID=A0A133U7K9_9EURY|nr:hypothetical protein AKJ61_01250 [candidate division MSBL1 archaeon SCGC-AAA259B11]